MSYQKAMKHSRNIRKQRAQSKMFFGFHTNSGFWPSRSWLEDCYWPYQNACSALGVTPVDAEPFYNWTVGKSHTQRHPETYALMTQAGTILQ